MEFRREWVGKTRMTNLYNDDFDEGRYVPPDIKYETSSDDAQIIQKIILIPAHLDIKETAPDYATWAYHISELIHRIQNNKFPFPDYSSHLE